MPIVTLILGMSRNKWSQWKEKPNSNQPCAHCKQFHHHYITHFLIYTPKIRPKSLFLGPFSHLFEDLSYAKTGITQKVVGCMTKFLHQSCWDSAAEFRNSHHFFTRAIVLGQKVLELWYNILLPWGVFIPQTHNSENMCVFKLQTQVGQHFLICCDN